ncbi:GP16 [Chrysodeixis includens nucleopolyhedrovirus]|uniref:GP16 n=1 Tax=Chrysodeixis includens nucleopolyhedrovirus TaxID=1207438 RepID=A0A5B8YRE9_9ABAC|nr:GP16 [Chrysodeixis includens nucleopolyhedrovirus]QED40637.1 GP16 [Chrysodeixis includens nucleopolyhedrovirus]
MNYSSVALIVLLVYLWQTGNLMHEVTAIRKFLNVLYETIEYRFDSIMADLSALRKDTFSMLARIQNTTLETYGLVVSNGNKIDVINNKIDSIIVQGNF